jgi:flagellar FliJ protein
MKRFNFRLQVVLDRALEEEEQQLLRLAEVQQQILEARRKLDAVEEARRHQLACMTEAQQASFDPLEMHARTLHLEDLGEQLARCREVLAGLERRAEQVMQDVIAAMRKRQVLEKLRDKQYADYCKEAERVELQTMEEAVLPRLAREQARSRTL